MINAGLFSLAVFFLITSFAMAIDADTVDVTNRGNTSVSPATTARQNTLNKKGWRKLSTDPDEQEQQDQKNSETQTQNNEETYRLRQQVKQDSAQARHQQQTTSTQPSTKEKQGN